MTTRSEQKEKRKWEILYAALDLFIRRGYSATKIKDIADAVPMSVGLLFHYFESKEALYTELVRLGTSGPTEMVQGIGRLSPLEFFSACARQTLAFASESSFTAKMFVLMGSVYHSEDIPEQARSMANGIDFYHMLAPLVKQGQADGTIRQGDPLALCTAFWTALQGAIAAHALNPELPLPEPEWIIAIIRANC